MVLARSTSTFYILPTNSKNKLFKKQYQKAYNEMYSEVK